MGAAATLKKQPHPRLTILRLLFARFQMRRVRVHKGYTYTSDMSQTRGFHSPRYRIHVGPVTARRRQIRTIESYGGELASRRLHSCIRGSTRGFGIAEKSDDEQQERSKLLVHKGLMMAGRGNVYPQASPTGAPSALLGGTSRRYGGTAPAP
eukprot:2817391-Pyramimonas_sp.AAC.2